MNKLLSGVLAIMFCIGTSAQTKLPPAWQSSFVKITSEGIIRINKGILFRILVG